ncbi:hypothetical protein WG66_008699 [Moniliophthora roreri]|nr:hypothetical protein WG66_008699 [Moniliophthora roreri]
MQVSFSLEQLLQFAVSARLPKEDGSVGLTLNPLPLASSPPTPDVPPRARELQGINIHLEFGTDDLEAISVSVHASCTTSDLSRIAKLVSPNVELEKDTASNPYFPNNSESGSVVSLDHWDHASSSFSDNLAIPNFPAGLPQYTWPSDPILCESQSGGMTHSVTPTPVDPNDIQMDTLLDTIDASSLALSGFNDFSSISSATTPSSFDFEVSSYLDNILALTENSTLTSPANQIPGSFAIHAGTDSTSSSLQEILPQNSSGVVDADSGSCEPFPQQTASTPSNITSCNTRPASSDSEGLRSPTKRRRKKVTCSYAGCGLITNEPTKRGHAYTLPAQWGAQRCFRADMTDYDTKC